MSYIKEALVTESPVTEEVRLREWSLTRTNHAITGLTTEAVELLIGTDPLNTKEEIGDVLWYIALLCDEWGLKYTASEYGLGDAVYGIMSEVGQLADLYKRAVFYGQTFEPILAQQAVSTLLFFLTAVARNYGFSLADCEKANIRKLRVRYPKQFSEYDALNRDLEVERKELE